MPRAVKTMFGELIHLRDDGEVKTVCGVIPFSNAPQLIHRDLMCKKCFSKGEWSAQQIGVVKIYEPKPIVGGAHNSNGSLRKRSYSHNPTR